MQHSALYRKVILSLTMALCLLFTFTFGASAHATSAPHNVIPQSTGGGCGSDLSSSRGDLIVGSCINYDGFSEELNADAYVSFRPNFSLGYISSCYVQIIILSNHGQYPGAFLQQNCVTAASNSTHGAHFGSIHTTAWNSGDNAITYVTVKMTYSGGTVSYINNVPSRRIYL